MSNQSSSINLLSWFDPRNRTVSTFGFILNRVTALGLTLYLFIHLIALSNLARGETAYDSFLEFAHQPVVKIGELLVVAAVLIHGMNGIRIALNSLGLGTRIQRPLLIGILVISTAITAYFAIRMF